MVTYFDSKKMEVDSTSSMIIDNQETSCYLDVSSNDTPEDQFMYLIDLAIEYGKIDYIKVAISKYKHLINSSYIFNANRIMMQLLEEQIEEMTM